MSFIQTPREQADQAFLQGMTHLNQAQNPELAAFDRLALLASAKAVFEYALDLNPNHSAAWKALGHTLQQSGESLEANLAYNVSAHLKGGSERQAVESASSGELLFVKLSSTAMR